MNWRITFEGREYREDDLTLLGASMALAVAGCDWDLLQPLHSPDAFCGLLAAFLHQQGEPFKEALARVAALGVVEARGMVSV